MLLLHQMCSKCYCKKPPQNKEMRRTPRMTKKRQNKKEWVRESMREREFLLRGLLLQSTRSGSCRLKGQSWIFITMLLPEEPELCPALHCKEIAPTLQPQTNQLHTCWRLGERMRHNSVCLKQAGFLWKSSCCHLSCWITGRRRRKRRAGGHTFTYHTLM